MITSEIRLILFFTEGVSLQTWHQVGMLERELAVYLALEACGVKVQLVTYGDQEDLGLATQFTGMTVHANRLNLPIEWYQRLIAWRLPGGDGQIYKSNQISGADFALHAARQRNARFIARCGYLLSDFEAKRYGRDSTRATKARDLEREVFLGADHSVVTTSIMSKTITDRYGLSPEKITVIPNYVQTNVFKPESRKENERTRLGFVGRLDSQKNLGALLDAVQPLDVDLIIVGDGPLRANLINQARTGHSEVHFIGNRPHSDLPALLNQCDMFVLPSLYEGHPKALIEAMACGLPVIGTLVPGIKELLRHEQTGLLCGTEPASIRAAVERLVNDANLRRNLGTAARQFALDHFALDKIAKQELALYHEVLA